MIRPLPRWRLCYDGRYVSPRSALVIGFLASPGAWLALSLKRSLGVDDALDCFAVHGTVGSLGLVLTGLLATKGVASHRPGLLTSGFSADGLRQLEVQLLAVAAVAAYAFLATTALARLLDRIAGPLRASPEEEAQGLDKAYHGESAWAWTASRSSASAPASASRTSAAVLLQRPPHGQPPVPALAKYGALGDNGGGGGGSGGVAAGGGGGDDDGGAEETYADEAAAPSF